MQKRLNNIRLQNITKGLCLLVLNGNTYGIYTHSILLHWHVQNATIPCCSQELLPFSCHSSPPTIRPFSLTSSCHLFLGLPPGLVPKFIHNTLLGIYFLPFCVHVKTNVIYVALLSLGLLRIAQMSLLVNINFLFQYHTEYIHMGCNINIYYNSAWLEGKQEPSEDQCWTRMCPVAKKILPKP
jgi:hypothetical protein